MIIENIEDKIRDENIELSCENLSYYRDIRLLKLLIIVFAEISVGTIISTYLLDHVWYSAFLILPLILVLIVKHNVCKKHLMKKKQIENRIDGYRVYYAVTEGETKYNNKMRGID